MEGDFTLVIKDYCIRATAANGAIRIFVASTQGLVERARQIHELSPVSSAALGRLLSAASIMGLMMGNDDDLLTASIKGSGPLGGLLACADGQGRVRGYAHNPACNLPLRADGKLDVSGAIGAGRLTIIRDMGLKEPYVGNIELISGEIAEDIAYYYAKSEQTPSVVALGVLVDKDYSIRRAGGYFIQLLPGADDSVIDRLEARLAATPPVTAMLDGGLSPEDILKRLASDFDYKITAEHPIGFLCNCSRERVEDALVLVDKNELEDMIKKDKQAEISCHFCNTNYHFNESQLRGLAPSAQGR